MRQCPYLKELHFMDALSMSRGSYDADRTLGDCSEMMIIEEGRHRRHR